MKANETLTLYRESDKTVLCEVQEGRNYFTPSDVKEFKGTIEEFLTINKNYTYENDFNNTDFNSNI